MQDFTTYENQAKACEMTMGLIPHPMVEPLESPTGMPLTSPMQVALLGTRPNQNNSTYVGSGRGSYASIPRKPWLGPKIQWIIDHFWPFRQLTILAGFFQKIGTPPKLVMALLGAVSFLLTTLEHPLLLPQLKTSLLSLAAIFTSPANTLSVARWLALGLGATFGFFLIPVIGKVLLLVTRFLAFTVFLAVCTAIGGVIYLGVNLAFSLSGAADKNPIPKMQQAVVRSLDKTHAPKPSGHHKPKPSDTDSGSQTDPSAASTLTPESK